MNIGSSKRGSSNASEQERKRRKHEIPSASAPQRRFDYGSTFVKQDASSSSASYANFQSQELTYGDSDESSENEELEIVSGEDSEDSSNNEYDGNDDPTVPQKVLTSPSKGAYKKHLVQTYTSSLESNEAASKQQGDGDKNYADFAYKMMQKMGYKKGTGLGKHGEGRTDIVEASKQRGRRGLGLKVRGFEGGEDVKWEDEAQASSIEEIDWLPSCDQPVPEYNDLIDCMEQGHRKLRIEDETHFCSQAIINTLLASKSAFDELDPEEMRQARTRSNPYETIRGAIFLNRAAMKMANMDHVFDRMFTEPKKPNGQPAISGNELLYFADVCAGPGGFSEYVLWKKNWNAKGFGFTLKGANDFKLEDFFAASAEMFEPYYGVGGLQGDGDIMRRDNLEEFQRFVFENTDGKGVHFVMGDGGFSVEGQENIQEILSKQLTLCQFLCALNVLREGGNFVCKTFDLFTPFSVGLIYLCYRVFDKVCLFKPVTSRPANSERYVVCQGLRAGWHGVRDYLFAINDRLCELKNTDMDILEVVPMSVMKEDVDFFEYIKNSHESLAIVQTRALKKIQAFAQNTTLFDPNQADMRKECLRLWGIPGNTRSAPKIPDPMQKFRDLIDESNFDYFHTRAVDLDRENLEQTIKSVYDFRCMISSGERVFILSLGRSHVYKWDGKSSSKWRKLIDSIRLELPKDTLFEAEIVQELKGEGKGQRKIESVHILDVMWLGGIDLRNEHYNVRMSKADMFVKAVFKPSKPDIAPLRTKQVYKMEELEQVFQQLEVKRVKGSGQMPRLCYVGKGSRCLIPTGVYFMKTTQEPWTVALSKSQNKKYFFNTATRESLFEIPKSSIASFKFCRQNRYHWAWVDGVKIHPVHPGNTDPKKISRDNMLEFIHKFVPR